MLKYIMVPSMTTHFTQLPNDLGPRTSPPEILDLMEDEDPDPHIQCHPRLRRSYVERHHGSKYDDPFPSAPQ